MTDQSVFADAFRRHVRPALRDAILEQAGRKDTFSQDVAAVMSLAIERGAGYLPGDHFDQLLEWVSATLIEDMADLQEADEFIAGLLREPSIKMIRQKIRSFIGLADG